MALIRIRKLKIEISKYEAQIIKNEKLNFPKQYLQFFPVNDRNSIHDLDYLNLINPFQIIIMILFYLEFLSHKFKGKAFYKLNLR